jgi:hypothetical protein
VCTELEKEWAATKKFYGATESKELLQVREEVASLRKVIEGMRKQIHDPWQNTDPRDQYADSRQQIIIMRPEYPPPLVGVADVNTKDDWCIITTFKDCQWIGVSDKWNSRWWWVPAPRKGT